MEDNNLYPEKIMEYIIEINSFAIHEWLTNKDITLWYNMANDFWNKSEAGLKNGEKYEFKTILGDIVRVCADEYANGWHKWSVNNIPVEER